MKEKEKKLSRSQYIVCFRHDILDYGVDEALILGILRNNCDFQMNNWVYYPMKYLQDWCGLSKYQVHKAVEHLIELGVLDKDLRGIPAQTWFKKGQNYCG